MNAIMLVYYAGGVCALYEIYIFAEQNGLRVIEDAAHALGSTYKEKLIDGFGDIACFSFDGCTVGAGLIFPGTICCIVDGIDTQSSL